MPSYIGIDLGTTNSAICSFDGESLTVHKSPEQNSVTPSMIYVDRRGRYYGTRAYNHAAAEPGRVASGFKRFMGTSTPIELPDAKLTLTPEECSAELLTVLYGYLPEEMRQSGAAGTVITVPAAFDLMQKDATLSAAAAAGIGRLALMQEPVAAIMSAMRTRVSDGMFLVYDLGGGTFDLALAESSSGRVTLIEHGGISVCGGRDFDRLILSSLVEPWLRSQFRLPDDAHEIADYSRLFGMALHSAERAKIELSSRDKTSILLDEATARTKDLDGNEIYLDVPMGRGDIEAVIGSLVEKTISHAQRVLRDAGVTADHVTRVVFVGGPTQYKPLRDRVCKALGIAQDTQVDPMTAVAEGAALFAEAYDWSQERPRKKATKQSTTDAATGLRLDYPSRTPANSVRVRCAGAALPAGNFEIQIDNLDSGWSSGRRPIRADVEIDLELPKKGQNRFKVFLFADGRPVAFANDSLMVDRATASIDGIPASHSIGVEVRDPAAPKRTLLKFLIRRGDALPKKGREVFRALESLRAGSSGALIFNLFEGEIQDQPRDNRPVGCLKITGSDFESGVIQPNDELVCEYEMSESGRLSLSVAIASVGALIKPGGEFYSRQEAEVDYRTASELVKAQSQTLLGRLEALESKVEDERLAETRTALVDAAHNADSRNIESVKGAADAVLRARQTLADLRRTHRRDIRSMDLETVVLWFEETNRGSARPSEVTAFEQMAKHAERAVDRPGGEFENILDEMRGMNWAIQARQPAWIVQWFRNMAAKSYLFADQEWFDKQVAAGQAAQESGDLDALRRIVFEMFGRRVFLDDSDDSISANIA